MGSLLGRLEARQAAARERIEHLRTEMTALAEKIAAEEEALARLTITHETMLELMAGPDTDEDLAFAAGREKERRAPAAGRDDGFDADTMVRAVPAQVGHPSVSVPSGVLVPVWSPGTDRECLPPTYQEILAVLDHADGGLRAREIAEGLGLTGEARHVEGLRGKLKRLVGRGWVSEPEPGAFDLAQGVRAPG